MAKVFISYKREDEAFARQIHNKLREWGHESWLDIDNISAGTIPGSKGWDDAVHRGMKVSQVVIGIMTPESLASENVLDEWGWALTNDRRLILLWLREVPEEDIPPRYIRIKWIDFRKKRAEGFRDLEHALDFSKPVTSATSTIKAQKHTVIPSDDELELDNEFIDILIESAFPQSPKAKQVTTTQPSNTSMYAPLATYLKRQSVDVKSLRLLFRQIEFMIGQPLPPSAKREGTWWANVTQGRVQSMQWLGAGWRVESVDYDKTEVTFERKK